MECLKMFIELNNFAKKNGGIDLFFSLNEIKK